ncbi:MAG: imidazolonepropionase [Candidatus Krumholzibacteriota bacterium]|nr:imidazolonepropionase [Candidatus Krumholzibacteriota bacterium]
MPETIDLLLLGAGQIVTSAGFGSGPWRGGHLSDPGVVRGGAIAVSRGRISAIGNQEEVLAQIKGAEISENIDAGGRVIMPGWVDPHTHAVFAGYRADEYESRIRGESYLDIEKKGGGIKRSVRGLREMDEERLFEISRRRLGRMLEEGVTTLEIKSGYGLDRENEIKQLRVIERLGKETCLDVVATFMGAHQVPPEYSDSDEYVDFLINEMIPYVASTGLAKFIDVFCEKGVFSVEQTRRILEAGKKHRFGLKVHSDEIYAIGGTELAVEIGAVSVEHLTKITPAGIRALAGSDTIGVLLPGTSFGLASKHFAPARDLIEAGAAIALSTDYNPGSAPSSSMPLTVSIACSQMGLVPGEAIVAATRNAAFAIGMGDELGSLEIGKKADIVIYDNEDYREIPSRAGQNHAVVVIKEGKVVRQVQDFRIRSEVGL